MNRERAQGRGVGEAEPTEGERLFVVGFGPAPVVAGEAIPSRAVVNGALGRFLPAGLLLTLPAMALGVPWEIALALAAIEVPMLVGFAAGLAALRPFLRPDAGVDGRRSVVAGLVAPLALFSAVVITSGATPLHFVWYAVLTGLATAIVMFFPWIRGHDDEDALDAEG